MKKRFPFAIIFILVSVSSSSQQIDEKYVIRRFTDITGKQVECVIVPRIPPKDQRMPPAVLTFETVNIPEVPAYDWSFGCSATSAAMMAGYYDRNGYANIYTGPTNSGIAPLDNSVWGTVTINGETLDQCPLSATMQGLDGRLNKGHVDDYWVHSNSTDPDPYITNGWIQHGYDDCTGDFMKTNQSAAGNIDGSTMFYFYTDGSKYIGNSSNWDGLFGLKLFFECRGYYVNTFYNQHILGYNGNPNGFTFSDYQQQINAGRPVLIQLTGHTMLGIGYSTNGNTVILYDTWDHLAHEMTWGGSYGGFTHHGISVVELCPNNTKPLASLSKMEYFIDIDPGYGNGTEVTVPADSLVVHTFNIPLLSISSGVHVLYLRCRDDNGRWSVTETMPFYRLKTEVKNIASMEYFIDTDPGTGNGIPIAIDPNSGQSITSVTIPLANITMGIHTLFIRAKDNYNRWSLVQSSSFYKADVPVQQLSRLEYFIDSDPGIGNGIPVLLQNIANETASFLVDLANLNNGIHTLYIRSKDVNQVWSSTANIPFYKFSGITDKNITALEVFIDTDPGHGQATQVQVYQPAPWFQQTFTVDLSCYPTGDHKLYIRTRDDQLHWSLTNMKPVTISVLPPTITVVGSLFLCEGESVLLKVPKAEGRIYQWLRNNAPIPGEADSTLETTLAGIYKCTINHSNICQDTTAQVEVVVYQHSVGGSVTGESRICKGSQTGLLSLYGQTGTVQKWQKRHNTGGWIDIAHTGITYQETPVYSGTWEYRAQVKNGTCPPEFSNPVTVIVDTTVITGPISGISELCQGTSAVNYYIQPVWNATGYNWTLPPGATIVSGENSNSIYVNFSYTALPGIIQVTGINTCGAGVPSPGFMVNVKPVPIPTITGSSSVCIGSTGMIYHTETGMTNYIWNVSSGGTITSGGTPVDNTVTVTWNSAGPQTVSVNYTNAHGCIAASETVLPITVHTLPVPSVIGPSIVCAATSDNVYTTESGMTSYVWNVSSGGTITSGGTSSDNTVTVTWNTAGPQSVSVNYTNTHGCTADNSTELAVTVNPRPIASIEGPEIVCAGTVAIYSTVEGMSHYTWHITGGGIVVSGGTSTSTTTSVIWNTPGNKMIGVKYSNSYGCFSTAYAFKFPVIKPVPVPSLSGNSEVCVGNVYTYTTDPGMSGYVWSVSAGGTIQSGTGTNNVQVLWNFTGNQNIDINYTNSEGCFAGNPTTLNVLPVTLPLAPGQINGPSMVVQGQENVLYTIVPLANTSQYHWSLPPGVTVVNGEGTDSILVKFAPMAISGILNVYGINACGTGPQSPDLNIMVNIAQQLQLSNVFLNNGDTTCYNAYQSIIVGGNGSGFAVQNGASAKFLAGQNIRFLPGTMVYLGGHLWAYITTDSTFCGTQPPSLFNAPENTLTNFTSDKTHGSLFRIYPNPTAGCFKMELNDDPGKSEYVIEIFNLVGKLINRRTIHEVSATECTLQNQPPGVYLVRVFIDDHAEMQKVVRQ